MEEIEKIKPAIVVVAFNRPVCLKNLLETINSAYYEQEMVSLIISIDHTDSKAHEEVIKIADEFIWEKGQKHVIKHSYNLGLRNHILSCGDLSEKFGSVIILEDDLRVSPGFYNYACKAAQFYEKEDKVAGISLYAYEYGEIGWFKFYPQNTGGYTFFMQWASSRGQLWTNNHWSKFRSWYREDMDLTNINIPDQVKNWKNSWKKYYIGYLVEKDRFFVYPYVSFTTLRDERGTNYIYDSRINNVQLLADTTENKTLNFSVFNSPKLMYDVFFQPKNMNLFLPELGKFIEVEFDFFGTKKLKNVRASYLCSIKESKKLVKRYSNKLIPYEENVINNELGKFFNLALTKDFSATAGWYYKGEKLYNTRKIYAIKEMGIVILYRVLSKILNR